jgi:uncharacterized membrane protein
VDDVIRGLFKLLLRAVLLMMGLVFLASLAVAAVLVGALWLVRALWARLTGRPVQPLAFTLIRRAQWARFYRPGSAARADDAEVIDVPSRQVSPAPESPGRLDH